MHMSRWEILTEVSPGIEVEMWSRTDVQFHLSNPFAIEVACYDECSSPFPVHRNWASETQPIQLNLEIPNCQIAHHLLSHAVHHPYHQWSPLYYLLHQYHHCQPQYHSRHCHCHQNWHQWIHLPEIGWKEALEWVMVQELVMVNGVRLLEQGLGIGVARQLPGPVVRRLWDGNYSCGAGIGDGLLNGMRLLE